MGNGGLALFGQKGEELFLFGDEGVAIGEMQLGERRRGLPNGQRADVVDVAPVDRDRERLERVSAGPLGRAGVGAGAGGR